MIRINLAPPEDIESPLWWVPDLAVFVGSLVIGVLGTNFYFGVSASEIERSKAETATLQDGIAAMQDEATHHKDLSRSIDALEKKLGALSQITESKTARYLPIILIEHLQNLRPEGVWFSLIDFSGTRSAAATEPKPPPQGAAPIEGGAPPSDSEAARSEEAPPPPSPPAEVAHSTFASRSIHLDGVAFDNKILSEFLAALKSTKLQEVDPADVRTQVYFESVVLEYSVAATVDQKIGENTQKLDVVNFKLRLDFNERGSSLPNPQAPLVNSRTSSGRF